MTAIAGVEVVIAVHDASRPIARAVRSVLDHNGEGVRVTVVCHEVSAETIDAALDPAHRERVRLLEHRDGIASPAGPFNAGIDAAEGEHVCVMGSDDQLAPGAIASWYWLARDSGAEAVIARLQHADGGVVRTPPTRPFRRRDLDGVKDRLSYRSAPLGLVARTAIERLGLRMEPGLAVGEDVAFVTRLWFGARIAYDRTGPAYLIGADAPGRVTMQRRPIVVELAFVLRLLRQPWFATLTQPQRHAVAVKLARIHLFGAVHNRPEAPWWTAVEREALAEVARALRTLTPGVLAVLSVADRRLLAAIEDTSSPAETMLALALARRRHGTPLTVLTRDPGRLLAREAPLRMMAASVLSG